jgi:hypothetical protein
MALGRALRLSCLLQELKQLMASHGGIFRNYIQKDVTHIICSNLPDSKVKHLENVKERCASYLF